MIGNRTLLLLFCLLAVVPLPVAVAGADGRLQFREKVQIATCTYTLEDIAVLDGLADQVKSRLAMVKIGQTPRPGQWTQVTQFEVAAVLEKALPGISRNLQWQGPAFVRIRGEGVLCDMDALKQSAQRYLLDRLRKQYDQVTVHLVGEHKPVVVAVGRVSFHSKMSAARRLQKRMPVWVDVFVEGEHFQTVPLWFAVSVHTPAWVVQKQIGQKQALTTDSAAKCMHDIAGLEGEPLRAASLEGLRAVRKLAAGAILTAEDVEPIPAVSQGELITVYVSHSTVRLQVKAVALADGQVSEQILVKNPGSGKSFRAMVIGTKQAMVN